MKTVRASAWVHMTDLRAGLDCRQLVHRWQYRAGQLSNGSAKLPCTLLLIISSSDIPAKGLPAVYSSHTAAST